MGYYEQIGVENMRHRERLARMPAWRRNLGKFVTGAAITAASLFLWALTLAPLWTPFVR